MQTSAKIIADSTTAGGHRLTTFEVTFHRFVLAEFNTHRVLSKNSASSRAIPFEKQVSRVKESLAYPLSWPAEQKGMQGGDEIPESDRFMAKHLWKHAAESVTAHARSLRVLGDPDSDEGVVAVHKSVVNRLLEPFMWHTVVVTGTAWGNFFTQRCSPLAQPEIRAVADLMKAEYSKSHPKILGEYEWHLPYIEDEDAVAAQRYAMERDGTPYDGTNLLVKISAARCARVSYLTQDGKRDIAADLKLYDRLVDAKPAHWSPLEHVATPDQHNRQSGDAYSFFNKRLNRWEDVPVGHLPVVGNLLGWRSLRTEVEAEQRVTTYV